MLVGQVRPGVVVEGLDIAGGPREELYTNTDVSLKILNTCQTWLQPSWGFHQAVQEICIT